MTPQKQFDAKYITSSEIRKRLQVARCTITLAHRRGLLPDPINVGGALHLWERTTVEPYLTAWELMLKARRGQLTPGAADTNATA